MLRNEVLESLGMWGSRAPGLRVGLLRDLGFELWEKTSINYKDLGVLVSGLECFRVWGFRV